MTKILDFTGEHATAIYITVGLAVAFLSGYVNPETPKDGKGHETIRVEAMFLAGLWPIFAVIAALSSPLWVPMLAAELGAWWAKREERKETVKKALDYAKLTHKDKP